MNARDLMSSDVVTVRPDTPLREVARTLLEHHMSAVPVVKGSGDLVGMVSEGDLVRRRKTERERKSENWLERLAEGELLNPEFLETMQSPLAVASDVMSSPVLAVSEETRADEIASIMGIHRVKRLPVLREGQIVGVVRRADLLRTLGGGAHEPVPMPPPPRPGHARVETPHISLRRHEPPPAPEPLRTRRDDELTVDDFRHLAAHHWDEVARMQQDRRREAAEQHRRDVRRLIDTHIADKTWNHLIHAAREAADRGETQFLLLRFPAALCSDAGRAVNAPDPDWPRTLRGEAAEVYLRWEHELRHRGFHIMARVLDFPDGVPGDIGLYLIWGR